MACISLSRMKEVAEERAGFMSKECRHLERCPRCTDALDQIYEDDVWAGLEHPVSQTEWQSILDDKGLSRPDRAKSGPEKKL